MRAGGHRTNRVFYQYMNVVLRFSVIDAFLTTLAANTLRRVSHHSYRVRELCQGVLNSLSPNVAGALRVYWPDAHCRFGLSLGFGLWMEST